jgi:hypothetical protein
MFFDRSYEESPECLNGRSRSKSSTFLARDRFEQAAQIGMGLKLIRLNRGDQAVVRGTRLGACDSISEEPVGPAQGEGLSVATPPPVANGCGRHAQCDKRPCEDSIVDNSKD